MGVIGLPAQANEDVVVEVPCNTRPRASAAAEMETIRFCRRRSAAPFHFAAGLVASGLHCCSRSKTGKHFVSGRPTRLPRVGSPRIFLSVRTLAQPDSGNGRLLLSRRLVLVDPE